MHWHVKSSDFNSVTCRWPELDPGTPANSSQCLCEKTLPCVHLCRFVLELDTEPRSLPGALLLAGPVLTLTPPPTSTWTDECCFWTLSVRAEASLHLSFPYSILFHTCLSTYRLLLVHLFTSRPQGGCFSFSHRQQQPCLCLSFSHPALFFNLRGEGEIRWEEGEGWNRRERERWEVDYLSRFVLVNSLKLRSGYNRGEGLREWREQGTGGLFQASNFD